MKKTERKKKAQQRGKQDNTCQISVLGFSSSTKNSVGQKQIENIERRWINFLMSL